VKFEGEIVWMSVCSKVETEEKKYRRSDWSDAVGGGRGICPCPVLLTL